MSKVLGPKYLHTSLMAEWQISVKSQDINTTELLHLAGPLMEHFLEGIAPLRHLFIALFFYFLAGLAHSKPAIKSR